MLFYYSFSTATALDVYATCIVDLNGQLENRTSTTLVITESQNVRGWKGTLWVI